MKTVKDIYDFFHQFPNKDKNSASLMEFLETIPGFQSQGRRTAERTESDPGQHLRKD